MSVSSTMDEQTVDSKKEDVSENSREQTGRGRQTRRSPAVRKRQRERIREGRKLNKLTAGHKKVVVNNKKLGKIRLRRQRKPVINEVNRISRTSTINDDTTVDCKNEDVHENEMKDKRSNKGRPKTRRSPAVMKTPAFRGDRMAELREKTGLKEILIQVWFSQQRKRERIRGLRKTNSLSSNHKKALVNDTKPVKRRVRKQGKLVVNKREREPGTPNVDAPPMPDHNQLDVHHVQREKKRRVPKQRRIPAVKKEPEPFQETPKLDDTPAGYKERDDEECGREERKRVRRQGRSPAMRKRKSERLNEISKFDDTNVDCINMDSQENKRMGKRSVRYTRRTPAVRKEDPMTPSFSGDRMAGLRERTGLREHLIQVWFSQQRHNERLHGTSTLDDSNSDFDGTGFQENKLGENKLFLAHTENSKCMVGRINEIAALETADNTVEQEVIDPQPIHAHVHLITTVELASVLVNQTDVNASENLHEASEKPHLFDGHDDREEQDTYFEDPEGHGILNISTGNSDNVSLSEQASSTVTTSEHPEGAYSTASNTETCFQMERIKQSYAQHPILLASFQANPESPSGDRLKELCALTSMKADDIQNWFSQHPKRIQELTTIRQFIETVEKFEKNVGIDMKDEQSAVPMCNDFERDTEKTKSSWNTRNSIGNQEHEYCEVLSYGNWADKANHVIEYEDNNTNGEDETENNEEEYCEVISRDDDDRRFSKNENQNHLGDVSEIIFDDVIDLASPDCSSNSFEEASNARITTRPKQKSKRCPICKSRLTVTALSIVSMSEARDLDIYFGSSLMHFLTYTRAIRVCRVHTMNCKKTRRFNIQNDQC